MKYELVIMELTKLHNNKLFENKRINGLVIKIYKRFRKELQKYSSACPEDTIFHKDIAAYAAGIIGYYAKEKPLHNFRPPIFQKIYNELKIINPPFVLSDNRELPDEQLLFDGLLQINQEFNLNNPDCFQLFKTLQKVYFLKRKKTQGLPGVTNVELRTMSAFFNFWPKKNSWDKEWTASIFNYFCERHPEENIDKPTKPIQSISPVEKKVEYVERVDKVHKPKKRSFWSFFRKQ